MTTPPLADVQALLERAASAVECHCEEQHSGDCCRDDAAALRALAAAFGDASDARVRRAIEQRDMVREELAAVLAKCRAARGLSLRAAGERIMCSAAMLLDIERGRRWSDGIVLRAVNYYARKDSPEAPHA